MLLRCLFPVLAVFLLPCWVTSQEVWHDPSVVFERYGEEHGLSDPEVISVFQDRYGYLWFGTVSGLNKFDGSSFEVFRHVSDDSLSLSSDLVECMAEDGDGNLWIGTANGLNRYNRSDNTFTRFFCSNITADAPGEGHIRALIAVGRILWFETLNGVLKRFDPATGRVDRYPHQAPYQAGYHYHTIYPAGDGLLWVGGRFTGILAFDTVGRRFRSIAVDPSDPKRKRDGDVSAYLEDSLGNFWISGVDGVYALNRRDGTVERVMATSTWDMVFDREGNIWMATGHGLCHRDKASGKIARYVNDPGNIHSLSGDQVNTVYVDRNGTLWAGTSNGVNHIAAKRYPFVHYRHIPGNGRSLSSDKVSALMEDRSGSLWIGTMGAGLNRFDRGTGIFQHYAVAGKDGAGVVGVPGGGGQRGTLAANRVASLYQDRRGSIWVGLWAGIGFQRFDTATGRFTTYRYNIKSLAEDWYNGFAEDRQGNFYLGFWGGPGLTLFDRGRGVFGARLKSKLPDADRSRLINVLLCGADGRLWIGTSTTGLICYDPVSGATKHYACHAGDSSGMLSPEVTTLAEGRRGEIWAGGHGITCISGDGGAVRHYTERDGLCDNRVMGLEMDGAGMLWVATRDGLSRFDPDRAIFQNFTRREGLPDPVFSRAHARLRSGELAFGSDNGFILFHPDQMVSAYEDPLPLIKNLRVPYLIKRSDLSETTSIHLNHDENFFSLELVSPGSINPGRVRFAYRLDPFQQSWQQGEEGRLRAVFTNVPPGEYTFLAAIVDERGEIPAAVRKLSVTVAPPLWKRWWFILAQALLGLVLVVALFLVREKQLTLKNRGVELRQKLLRSQMNPHFIFNSLFAIQNYIYAQQPDQAGRYLSDFAKLIRLILNNSREEYITLENELMTLRLYLHLQSLRFEGRFDYHLEVDPGLDAGVTAIPPMLAQPFIENALEHGLRSKPGRGHLAISITLHGDMVRFTITDDGVGLQPTTVNDDGVGLQGATVSDTTGHKSLALEITRERITLLNRKLRRPIRFTIADRGAGGGDGAGEGLTGTVVIFEIPFFSVSSQHHSSEQEGYER